MNGEDDKVDGSEGEHDLQIEEAVCGKINQHGKPCQRVGKCPFHSEVVKKTKQKKGWTKEEHKRFLCGLKLNGRGSWKEIARVVGTKTPTQIQSHAQKYFLRQKQAKKNKRSIHDISLEEMEAEEQNNKPPVVVEQPKQSAADMSPENLLLELSTVIHDSVAREKSRLASTQRIEENTQTQSGSDLYRPKSSTPSNTPTNERKNIFPLPPSKSAPSPSSPGDTSDIVKRYNSQIPVPLWAPLFNSVIPASLASYYSSMQMVNHLPPSYGNNVNNNNVGNNSRSTCTTSNTNNYTSNNNNANNSMNPSRPSNANFTSNNVMNKYNTSAPNNIGASNFPAFYKSQSPSSPAPVNNINNNINSINTAPSHIRPKYSTPSNANISNNNQNLNPPINMNNSSNNNFDRLLLPPINFPPNDISSTQKSPEKVPGSLSHLLNDHNNHFDFGKFREKDDLDLASILPSFFGGNKGNMPSPKNNSDLVDSKNNTASGMETSEDGSSYPNIDPDSPAVNPNQASAMNKNEMGDLNSRVNKSSTYKVVFLTPS